MDRFSINQSAVQIPGANGSHRADHKSVAAISKRPVITDFCHENV